MKRFWRKRDVTPAHTSPEATAVESLSGLSMLLDKKGQIVEISRELQRLLPSTSLELPRTLSSILATPFAQAPLPINEWPSQLSLVLRGQDADARYMQGAKFYQAPHWCIILIDNTHAVARHSQEELRSKALDFTVQHSTAVGTASSTVLQNHAQEWLEGLMLRLRLPWLCLLKRETTHWHEYATATLPSARSIHSAVEEAQSILQNLYPKISAPIRLVLGEHKTPVALLPYMEQDGVHLWLMIPDHGERHTLYGLAHSDWMALLYLFCSPLHSALSYQQMQHTVERNAYLQKMLASGWWEYHPEQQKLYMDTSLATVLGLALQHDGSVSFETALQAIDPLDEMEYRHRVNRAVSEGVKLSMVLRVQVSGQSCWYRMLADRVEGESRRLVGYAMNIDDLRQMETAVDDAQARFEGLIYNAPAIVYILAYKNDAFHLDFCSASMTPMLGWTYEQLQDISLGGIVHPDDREEYYQGLREILQIGAISRRYRVRDVDGVYHWILDEAKLLRDERGRPKEIVGLSIDVTEATESAELVRESEERYRMLVEDAPAIICRFLPDLSVVYGNRQLFSSLGFSADTALDTEINLGDFLSPAKRQELLARYAQLTPDNPGGSIELLLNLSENVHAWWVWSDRALFDEQGRIIEIQSVGRDNTEVHNARQQVYQSAKMATLGEMATGLAHEISQPLTVMRMALTNILKRLAGADAMDPKYLLDKLERLESQIMRVTKVVDHMRIFGRHSEVEGTLFDPLVAIQEAVLLVKEGMEKDAVPVQINLELAPLPQIKGHIDRFEQVLINLLLNAQYAAIRQFTGTGRPAVLQVSSYVTQNTIYIAIEDSGGGVPVDLLERIFEPFVTTKPVGKGTGLGLSVSYGIINLMGGKLTVKNGTQGARFTIAVPVAAEQ